VAGKQGEKSHCYRIELKVRQVKSPGIHNGSEITIIYQRLPREVDWMDISHGQAKKSKNPG
jgi:hypothetical protein